MMERMVGIEPTCTAWKAGDLPMIHTRDILYVNCASGDHVWESAGGCNAGCDDNCRCSVPVNTCARCGDCDYGDNPDATEIRRHCAETRSD
jgi:hypothetical protein